MPLNGSALRSRSEKRHAENTESLNTPAAAVHEDMSVRQRERRPQDLRRHIGSAVHQHHRGAGDRDRGSRNGNRDGSRPSSA